MSRAMPVLVLCSWIKARSSASRVRGLRRALRRENELKTR